MSFTAPGSHDHRWLETRRAERDPEIDPCAMFRHNMIQITDLPCFADFSHGRARSKGGTMKLSRLAIVPAVVFAARAVSAACGDHNKVIDCTADGITSNYAFDGGDLLGGGFDLFERDTALNLASLTRGFLSSQPSSVA